MLRDRAGWVTLAGVRAQLAYVPDWGLYQLTIHSGGGVAWLLLGPDQAHTLAAIVRDLPDRERNSPAATPEVHTNLSQVRSSNCSAGSG